MVLLAAAVKLAEVDWVKTSLSLLLAAQASGAVAV
jgi:hypothetical protein